MGRADVGRADVGREKEALSDGTSAARRAWRRANSSCRIGSSKSGSSTAKTRSAKFDMAFVVWVCFFVVFFCLVRLLQCVFAFFGGREVCVLRVLKETKMGFGWHKCFFGRLRVLFLAFWDFAIGTPKMRVEIET